MRFPVVEEVLIGILRPFLEGLPVPARLVTLLEENSVPRTVMARRVAGAAIDLRFLDSAIVDIQVMTEDITESGELAEDVRQRLVQAWREQIVVPGQGSIAWLTELAGPALLDIYPERTFRYQASYSLAVRPDNGG